MEGCSWVVKVTVLTVATVGGLVVLLAGAMMLADQLNRWTG